MGMNSTAQVDVADYWGQPVAVASGPAGCGVIDLTLYGQNEPDLQPPGSYLATVLKIAGLHWQLP